VSLVCVISADWNTTGIGRFVTCAGLVKAMKEKDVAVLSHGATGRGNDQMRFERYTNVLAPNMSVYAPWRDAELLEEFPGRTEMAAYLNKFGIEAFVGPKKKYSTDANLAGLSHEAEDLESVETSMLIVEPEMGKWPAEAPDAIEEVELQFEAGRCVAVNGKRMTPLQVITEANAIGGRNGLGVSHALENRIIGTKSRGAASPARPALPSLCAIQPPRRLASVHRSCSKGNRPSSLTVQACTKLRACSCSVRR